MPLVLDGQKTCRIFENPGGEHHQIQAYRHPGLYPLMPQEPGARDGVQKHFRHRAGFQRGRDHRPLCAGRPFSTPRAAAWALPLPRALPNCRAERSPSQWTATCSRPRICIYWRQKNAPSQCRKEIIIEYLDFISALCDRKAFRKAFMPSY